MWACILPNYAAELLKGKFLHNYLLYLVTVCIASLNSKAPASLATLVNGIIPSTRRLASAE